MKCSGGQIFPRLRQVELARLCARACALVCSIFRQTCAELRLQIHFSPSTTSWFSWLCCALIPLGTNLVSPSLSASFPMWPSSSSSCFAQVHMCFLACFSCTQGPYFPATLQLANPCAGPCVALARACADPCMACFYTLHTRTVVYAQLPFGDCSCRRAEPRLRRLTRNVSMGGCNRTVFQIWLKFVDAVKPVFALRSAQERSRSMTTR